MISEKRVRMNRSMRDYVGFKTGQPGAKSLRWVGAQSLKVAGKALKTRDLAHRKPETPDLAARFAASPLRLPLSKKRPD
jgi:hypothetical protein